MKPASDKDNFPKPTRWTRVDAIEAFGVCYVVSGDWRAPVVETLGARAIDPFSATTTHPTEAAALAHVRQAARAEAEREISRVEGIMSDRSFKARLAVARSFKALRRNGVGILATESIFSHRLKEYRSLLKNGVPDKVKRLPERVRLPIVLPVGLPIHVVDTRGFPGRPLERRLDEVKAYHLVESSNHAEFDALPRYELKDTPGLFSFDFPEIDGMRLALHGFHTGLSGFILEQAADDHVERFAKAIQSGLTNVPETAQRSAIPKEVALEGLASSMPEEVRVPSPATSPGTDSEPSPAPSAPQIPEATEASPEAVADPGPPPPADEPSVASETSSLIDATPPAPSLPVLALPVVAPSAPPPGSSPEGSAPTLTSEPPLAAVVEAEATVARDVLEPPVAVAPKGDTSADFALDRFEAAFVDEIVARSAEIPAAVSEHAPESGKPGFFARLKGRFARKKTDAIEDLISEAVNEPLALPPPTIDLVPVTVFERAVTTETVDAPPTLTVEEAPVTFATAPWEGWLDDLPAAEDGASGKDESVQSERPAIDGSRLPEFAGFLSRGGLTTYRPANRSRAASPLHRLLSDMAPSLAGEIPDAKAEDDVAKDAESAAA